MKYLYSFIIVLLISANAESTERAYHNYIHSNLNFSFCYNITSYDPSEYFYYKGLSTLINDYIVEKVRNSEVDNRKFEIQAGCTVFGSYPSIEISRSKNGYFVFIHGDTNIYQLVRIINFFASNAWKSFCYDFERVDPERALRTFNGILDKVVGVPNLEFFNNRNIKVWDKRGLTIVYKPDELIYNFDEKKFDYKLSSPFPAKLKDRYFFVKNSTIHVIQDDNIILEQIIPDFDDVMPYLYSMVPYRKWLNVYYRRKPVLSYSYEKNRFYRIRNDS